MYRRCGLACGCSAAATWIYDDAGQSFGMQPVVFFLMLASPLGVAFLYGWRQASLRAGTLAGMAVGALFGVANMLGQLLWGGLLTVLGRAAPSPPSPWIDTVMEAAGFVLLFAFVGLLLGPIGGFVGAWVAQRRS